MCSIIKEAAKLHFFLPRKNKQNLSTKVCYYFHFLSNCLFVIIISFLSFPITLTHSHTQTHKLSLSLSLLFFLFLTSQQKALGVATYRSQFLFLYFGLQWIRTRKARKVLYYSLACGFLKSKFGTLLHTPPQQLELAVYMLLAQSM